MKLNCRKTLFLFLARKHVFRSLSFSLSLSVFLSLPSYPNLAFSLSRLPPSHSSSTSPPFLPFSLRPPFILSLLPVFAQLTRVSICFIKLRRAPFYSSPSSSIRDEIYPPPTHRRQPASLPHPVPLAALFFQNRSTRGNKKESLHYAHPTLQPFLTNLIPPALSTRFSPSLPPSYSSCFSLSLHHHFLSLPPSLLPPLSVSREKLPRCINERAHLPVSFMEKHTFLVESAR